MSTTGTMQHETIAGTTPRELDAAGIEWRKLHVCPVCNYKWARGAFGAGTLLEVECRQCRNKFVYHVNEHGLAQVHSGRAAQVLAQSVIRQMNVCLETRTDGRAGAPRTCATPWSRGHLGFGTAVRMKCKRCQCWTNIFK